jgi:hypothetical protein
LNYIPSISKCKLYLTAIKYKLQTGIFVVFKALHWSLEKDNSFFEILIELVKDNKICDECQNVTEIAYISY